VEGSAQATATSITGDAFNPTFGSVTRTNGGFAVQITDYDAAYTWSPSVDAGGSATVSENGLVTVIGLGDGVTATLTVDVTRTGYNPGTASIQGESLEAARTPEFGTPTPTAHGFTVEITNYDSDFDWDATATANGQAAVDGAGLVTVTNVAPGTESTVTVTTEQVGYVSGTASSTATSINGAAYDPIFGAATRIAGGFKVQITNYDTHYVWTPSATNGGQPAISGTGLVTVTGLSDGATSTLTVDVTRTGYDPGTASIGGQALNAALTPTFGTPLPTPHGFTVQITNYDAQYEWAGTATETNDSVVIDGTGLVTVAGVDPATASTVTVTTERSGHIDGSAQTTATSLAEALNPTFGTPTRTADGFTVSVTNFADDDQFTWAIGSATVGQANFDQTSGLITVTGLQAAASSTVTVTTTRTGYVSGSGTVVGTALNAALTPTFGTATRTADGYRVQLSNYNANFVWAGSATVTSTPVTISGTGLVTVAGLAPGTTSELTVTTTRTGYVGGRASTQATSLNAALVPTFTELTRTVDGFQATVSNYDADFTWNADATNTDYDVEVNGAGLIEVTGVAPGVTSVVTVTTTRIGYATGTAEVSASAIEGGALIPIFGPVIRTAVGFDVQIKNYRAGFEWTVNGATATISPTGYLSVTGLAPGTTATVTVVTTRAGFATGENAVVGAADPQATSAPPAVAPQQATITSIKVKQKKNNKSSAKISFTPGGDGGAPLLGSKAVCRQSGSKTLVKASGSSLSELTVKKLKNKKKYVCTVAVYNALGASVPSASKSFKVKG
jgi:titin